MASPPTIRRLDTSVINKIAAGEIIIQPANALKEMLENSIDASSTMIEIIVKDGGLKLLQITDNGHGINKDDLGLLCERFATSKLAKFEDLESIATYGFRGEALASISHISRLSVITKVKESPLAYKSYYANGKMVGPNFKTVAAVEPKPIAGKDGTQIVVEDLFYNIPQRLKSLKSKSEEFSKILDVIGRYAVHSEGVGINCKKFGEPHLIVSTRPGLPLKERVRTVFGNSIANELLDVSIEPNAEYGLFKVTGGISSPNYDNKKKIQPVFFINHRLVTCDPLKRAINSVYQIFLPKGSQSFVYLSLEIDPKNVDVNIHPTKREVRFLNEEEIIETISGQIHTILSGIDTSRKFKTQSILGFGKRTRDEDYATQSEQPKKRQENKLVRVDSSQSKINSFISSQSTDRYKQQMSKELQASQKVDLEEVEEADSEEEKEKDIEENEEEEVEKGEEEGEDEEVEEENNSEKEEAEEAVEEKEENDANLVKEEVEDDSSDSEEAFTITDRARTRVNLDSIKQIRSEVGSQVHKKLTNIFNNAVYVGIVDERRRLCCFQYDVNLYLCDYSSVLQEFFFQLALEEFCNYGTIKFSKPLLIEDLLQPLQDVEGIKPKEVIMEKLASMSEMLEEYFRILIHKDDQGRLALAGVPMILKEIKPVLSKLSYFVYRLGAHVEYEDEKACLQGVMNQISLLYIPAPIHEAGSSRAGNSEESAALEISQDPPQESDRGDLRNALDHTLENVLFPQLRSRFLATRKLEGDVIQIADLPGLYRVFERC